MYRCKSYILPIFINIAKKETKILNTFKIDGNFFLHDAKWAQVHKDLFLNITGYFKEYDWIAISLNFKIIAFLLDVRRHALWSMVPTPCYLYRWILLKYMLTITYPIVTNGSQHQKELRLCMLRKSIKSKHVLW